MFTDRVTRIIPIEEGRPVLREIPSEADKARALAANLRERATTVERAGEPVIQTFTRPSFRELQAEERSQADNITEFAALAIFGVQSSDRLTPKQANALEGAAMYLVRRIHPEWMKAAVEQAVDTLLVSDEYVALTVDRSWAEKRLIAHRLTQSVLGALIGVLENERSVRPECYLRIAAAKAEAGAL